MQKAKELNDFQRIPLEIEILSNLRFDSHEIRDTSVTRVTNKSTTCGTPCSIQRRTFFEAKFCGVFHQVKLAWSLVE